MKTMKNTGIKWFSALMLFSLLAGLLPAGGAVWAQEAPAQPEFVGLPGTHQSELGCSGDWQPECEQTALVYDAEDGIWQASFLIQPENDQDKKGARYKVALNKAWGENYGANAQSGGADIPLIVSEPTQVKFYYDNSTHWVADSFNNTIATLVGNFQTALGCQADNDPGCLRSWLQDPDGDGVLVFSTTALPAGDYEVRVAINESLDEVYGQDGAKDGAPITFSVPEDGHEMYFGYTAAENSLLVSTEGAPKGDLGDLKAHWVLKDSLAWQVAKPKEGESFALVYSPTGGIKIEPGKISGGEQVALTYERATQPEAVAAKFPHLASYASLKLDAAGVAKAPEILKGQVVIAAFNAAGKLTDASGVQIPGALDDLYTYDGPLGISLESGVPVLRVWAPTARSVSLHLFDDAQTSTEQVLPMTADPANGVWSLAGTSDWLGKYYLYEVEVYVPATGQVEKNLVTDPYSISLATNSLRSQIVDLADPALKPDGWETLVKPELAAPEDSVIYELHIRDFSVTDLSVPEAQRGTYLAFTQSDSNGMKHLQSLAKAGLTHIHLLPTFDIASINEDKSTWQTVDPALLAAMPSDSDEQALALQPFRDLDGFNWGYDPFHYSTPEGSYATDPNGAARLVEFRQMVQALNQTGLRVVMDVVYNHTNASGQSAKSVLDKVVPGYYHRLNAEGKMERSTCCENTATEHAMMEKLMIDSVVLWAKEYKVDGFRFDLMGHHMLGNMVQVRDALDALTLEKDGVDGPKIILYGEGWDFGEVAKNARGQNATQLNLAGSGIGSFNDRLRDAVRGGGPFAPVQEQGFITGLFTAPNDYMPGRPNTWKYRLFQTTDWIMVGLAGGLKDYELTDYRGNRVTGDKIDYNGAPAGYTLDPQEQIVYISAHDNETLFDAIQYKTPVSATATERARINNLGVSLVLFSQGIPFFHAGDDLLRSKSLDGNSYNSGDWYNRIDFTYQTNNWAVGLPDFRADQKDLMRALFNNPNLKVSPAEIQFAQAVFLEMLQIRKSSPLFRLQTGELVKQRVQFLEPAEGRVPGLIVMVLDDTQGGDLDPNYEKIVVVFNAQPDPTSFADETLKGLALELHPIQAASIDEVVKTAAFDPAAGSLAVPGRTAVVFVLKQTVPEPTVTVAAPEPAATTAPIPTEPLVVSPTEPPAPAATVEPVAETPAGFPWLPVGLGALVVAGLGYFLWRRSKTGK